MADTPAAAAASPASMREAQRVASPTLLAKGVAFARRNSGAVIGAVILLSLVLLGFFLPLPYDPVRAVPGALLTTPPSSTHWFGTDMFAFDVFSRTVLAAANDIPVAAAGVLLSLLLGVPLGLFASAKGRTGEYLMRGVDAFQSFPILILAIAAVVLLGNELSNVVAAIAIINVPRFMRIIRSEALSIRESRYIEAAVAIGASKGRIMFRHLLPNVTGIILVQMSLAAANALVIITTLSFLGIGVSPPNPTWGSMIQEGARVLTQGHWWIAFFPSLAIFISVTAFNLIADSSQNAIDRQERG